MYKSCQPCKQEPKLECMYGPLGQKSQKSLKKCLFFTYFVNYRVTLTHYILLQVLWSKKTNKKTVRTYELKTQFQILIFWWRYSCQGSAKRCALKKCKICYANLVCTNHVIHVNLNQNQNESIICQVGTLIADTWLTLLTK